MKCGVSTACMFPMQTVEALQQLQHHSVAHCEIFMNTVSELSPEMEERLVAAVKGAGTQVYAMHPFSSGWETFFFGSAYPMRFEDGLALYKQYFALCRQLAIPRLVLHGVHAQASYGLPFEEYCKRLLQLNALAEEYGVHLVQENVVRCLCGFPDAIYKLREYTDDKMLFVLDLKQLRRADVSVDDMLQAMGGRIDYLHLSDATQAHDCLAPGEGTVDFTALFEKLLRQNFTGDMVVELYRHNFEDIHQLTKAAATVDAAYETAKKRREHS